MSDQSAKFTNDIRIIGDTITVQFFSLFYHHFLSANNNYIEKYHELMRILKRNGDRIDGDSRGAIFDVAGTVPLADIRNFLHAAFTETPEMMLAEDELLPLEEEFFRERDPQFRRLLLRENFPVKDVSLFRRQLISFSRLTEPILTEMEKAGRETEILLRRRNYGQLFDVLFRYCVSWQNLIDVLKNHARELYGIYHSFFMQGLFDKYSRFYCDIAAAEPQAADTFFGDFLKTEIMAYDREFDRIADPENPEDRQTLRDVCKRVEDFFKYENGRKFY
jgi:hypothetical protein